jgi:hypothetical protein
MNKSSSEPLKRASQEALGLGIYRMLLTFALLLVAFSAFPAYKLVIGLAVLALTEGITAVAVSVKVIALAQNHLDDMAERKTRHGIVLAAERSGQQNASYFDFWHVVDERVADEMRPDVEPSNWAKFGMVLGHVAGRILSAVALLVPAFLLSPPY